MTCQELHRVLVAKLGLDFSSRAPALLSGQSPLPGLREIKEAEHKYDMGPVLK